MHLSELFNDVCLLLLLPREWGTARILIRDRQWLLWRWLRDRESWWTAIMDIFCFISNFILPSVFRIFDFLLADFSDDHFDKSKITSRTEFLMNLKIFPVQLSMHRSLIFVQLALNCMFSNIVQCTCTLIFNFFMLKTTFLK